MDNTNAVYSKLGYRPSLSRCCTLGCFLLAFAKNLKHNEYLFNTAAHSFKKNTFD